MTICVEIFCRTHLLHRCLPRWKTALRDCFFFFFNFLLEMSVDSAFWQFCSEIHTIWMQSFEQHNRHIEQVTKYGQQYFYICLSTSELTAFVASLDDRRSHTIEHAQQLSFPQFNQNKMNSSEDSAHIVLQLNSTESVEKEKPTNAKQTNDANFIYSYL